MKRMIKYVVVILFMMAILCGCEEKMKKTDKTAVKAAIDKLDVYDDKFMTENDTFVGGVMKNNWNIKFRDYGKDKTLCNTDFKMELLSIDPTTKTEAANYVVTETETEKEYKICTRIDNTYLYLCGPLSQKDEIRKFAADLGYVK